ncbi:MAG TPA: hypothetical protein VGP70_04035 [Actinomadura sp.]|jgi:hypothetical protein|nr:hypothetical protein [Actinomadura sp.]
MSSTAPIIDLRPCFEDTGTPPDPSAPHHLLGQLNPINVGHPQGGHA